MAVRCGACLEMPGASGLGKLRPVCPFTGQARRRGVGQRTTLAKECSMDRRRRVRVEVAEAPRLALRVGGLEVVQQLLVVQVLQPRAVVRHAVGIPRDKEVSLLVAVHVLVH